MNLEPCPAPVSADALRVTSLGPSRFLSPLRLSTVSGDGIADYVDDDARVLLDTEVRASAGPALALEKAGPRPRIFFDPRTTRAGIVTCGGLCPGLDNVIRSIVLELWHRYGTTEIRGFRYGYEGLNPAVGKPPMRLAPEDVRHIHKRGGSILGLGRGEQPVSTMVDTLVAERIDMLFAIGGDGTLRGAHALHEEIARRGLAIAVVGVPKTIDNDVAYVDRTFGFETAVEVATQALDAAHTEALSARNGIGLVKLMGRDAGFIAAHACLASADANFCLVPEVPFALAGEHGFLEALTRRLAARGHALVVVAEGCADAQLDARAEAGAACDASGNVRYGSGGRDVAPLLRDAIAAHFAARQIPITLKVIDPSYMIRSVPANANDAIFCDQLARHAVHAAMAGKSDLVLGRRHGVFVHVPIEVAIGTKKRIDPDGALWLAVTEATGQPRLAPPRAS